MKKSVKKCLALVLAVIMLMSLLTVGASAATTSGTFTDIAGSSHAHAIQELVKAGILKGVSATRFDPDGTVTRAMAVTVLGRMANAEEKISNAFTDVDNSSWYAGYVGWAVENGIVVGVGGGRFNPESPITGQELDLMLARYAALTGISYEAANTSTATITRGELAEMVFYVYALPYLPSTSINVDPAVPITVEGGQIIGTLTEDSEIAMWKGIPYAAPPVGELRWKAPQPVESWDGVKECLEFGPSAMQRFQAAAAPYTAEFLVDFDDLSEDCLTLDVWSRAGSVDTARPVVVYIHGGGFTSGGANCEIYDGELMARDDVVYVSINYRLGILGFLAHPDLSAESELGISGNYAVLDWIKALTWVQDYISEFGGDPNNVTIVGQSAGGMAINTLVGSPLAKGLFAKAFIMSGIGGDFTTSLEAAEAGGVEFCEKQGKTLDELRAMPADELMNLRFDYNGPVEDGYAVIGSTPAGFRNGTANDVPMMIGLVGGDTTTFGGIFNTSRYTSMTAEEYESIVKDSLGELADRALELYPAAGDDSLAVANQFNVDGLTLQYLQYAQAKATTSQNPVYVYAYTWPYAGQSNLGPFHSSDIPYWLGGVFSDEQSTWSDADSALAEIMSGYLVNFATNGDVNGEGLPQWTAYNENLPYMSISSANAVVGTAITPEKQAFWADLNEWQANRPEEDPNEPSGPYSTKISWSDALADCTGILTIKPATSEWIVDYTTSFGPYVIGGTYDENYTLTVTNDGGLGGYLDLPPLQAVAGPEIEKMLHSQPINWEDAMADCTGILTIKPATSEWIVDYTTSFGSYVIGGTYDENYILTVTNDGGLGGYLDLPPLQAVAGPAIKAILYSRQIVWSDALADCEGTLTIDPDTSEWTVDYTTSFGPYTIGGTYTADGTLTVTNDGGLGGFLDLPPLQAVAGPAILAMLS